ncbi:MAG: choice-of-anchor B family protein, partial [Xanthomonadales bacterium]|nr:choice-of-anchor B family protein [Xanthomonadales bacterium]
MPKLHPFRSITAAAAIGLLLLHAPITASAAERDDGTGTEHDDHGTPPAIIPGTAGRLCESGIASGFPCRNVELLSRVPLEDLGGTFGNDVWGWSLSEASRAALGCPEPREARFALMGLSNGVAFVDVTVPEQARVRGFLPTVGDSSTWRDIKVYRDHAYIVADNNPEHALQVFDLAQLLEPWEGAQPQQFEASYRYTEFGSAHNIAINEDSGFAFVVGSDTCAGGLHMLDLTEPAVPAFAGCFDGDGYTHDVHCVTYSGPQEAFSGRELCFASNEDSLTITDVSNKQAPVLISKLDYPNVAYTHQGWLSDDHRWFVLGDELDELNTGANARTLVFDVSNPGEPAFAGAHAGASNTIDHNLYLRGNYVFQANYTAGLRILLAEDFGTARFREVGYFDTAPESEERQFRGAWSVYPFFDNGTILVSDMQAGLFVLRAELAAAENAPINGRLSGAYASPMLPDQGM